MDFYASADTQITESDFHLGQISLSPSQNTWTMTTLHCTLPTDIPAGTYYVGWIIDSGNVNNEINKTNNIAFNPSSMLTVIEGLEPILYVDVDARGANDGSSWADAFRNLQDALAEATAGCEIRVAQGVYTPDRGAGVVRRDRRATFALKSGVVIAGGYAGAGQVNPNARDIEARPTILSGDLNGDDQPVGDPYTLWKDASRMDNSRHVVTAIDADHTAVLDGVRITGGCADGWFDASGTPQDAQGAGMYVSGGGPRLRRCTFSGNWASTDGGALYATDSSPELLDCTICENAAGSRPEDSRGAGGAIFVVASSLDLISCSLHGNVSGGSGGALVLGPAGSLSAANCCFHANHAMVQAGAIYILDGQASLANCTLAYNRQDGNPGAIVHESSGNEAKGRLSVANCVLWNDGQEIASLGSSLVTVAHSDVRGGRPGAGNLDADPRFANPSGPDGLAGTEDDDLRLGGNSPCIDAGDAAALPKDAADLDSDRDILEPLPLDREGNARVVGNTVDMGAYEIQSPADRNPSD